MIKAVFFKSEGSFDGFSVSGHAGYAESGRDIVCASVSSAAQMAVNGVTECAKVPASVKVLENEISLRLAGPQKNSPGAQMLLGAFYLQLTLIKQEFPKFITVTVSEV